MITTKVALRCKISRGGFSDERVFELEAAQHHKGVCSRTHLWKDDGTPVEEGEPPLGQEIEGLVAARIIQVLDGQVVVSIPDGEVVTVNSEQLGQRPNPDWIGGHVPLGS